MTTNSPLEILQEFLTEAFDPNKVSAAADRLVAEDADYVSLNFENPELGRLMPWAGTSHGRQAFVDNFTGVTHHWAPEAFEVMDTVSEGERVALFGRFTLRSKTLGKAATSPCAVLAKVRDGRITYFQFMEDTFATARTFRSGGTWTIKADPDTTEPFEI